MMIEQLEIDSPRPPGEGTPPSMGKSPDRERRGFLVDHESEDQ